MTFFEFLAFVKSGTPMRLCKRKAYLRLTASSLTAYSERGEQLHLWIGGPTGRLKTVVRALTPGSVASLRLEDWWDLAGFLRKWEDMRAARGWSKAETFPTLSEVAAFCYLTLVPDFWQVLLEEEDGTLSVPLEHQKLHTGSEEYAE